MGHKEKILQFLQERPGNWFDDDELSNYLKIYPRQAVNQICRSLASKGLIQRERVDEKIRNSIPSRFSHTTTILTTKSAELPTSEDPLTDWYWEGNIQNQIALYLKSIGWSIEHLSDTASSKRGIDIRARNGDQVLLVEVKGYPSNRYYRGPKKGQLKPTPPTSQARHWFAGALLSALLMKTQYPWSSRYATLP